MKFSLSDKFLLLYSLNYTKIHKKHRMKQFLFQKVSNLRLKPLFHLPNCRFMSGISVNPEMIGDWQQRLTVSLLELSGFAL